MKKVLLSGAMDIEMEHFHTHIQNRVETLIDGFWFWEGEIGKTQVILSKTNVGKVNAALASYIGVKHFCPDYMVNFGTAGAHDPSLNIGTVIVGGEVLNGDAWVTSVCGKGQGCFLSNLKKRPDEVPGRDGTILLLDRYCCDATLVEMAMDAAKALAIPVRQGILYSSDTWNREYDKLDWANQTHQTIAEEMESAAVAHVAQMFSLPFVALRVISNNEYRNIPFDHSVSRHFTALISELLRRVECI